MWEVPALSLVRVLTSDEHSHVIIPTLTYELRWKLTVLMKRSPPLVMQGMGIMLMEGR